MIPTGYSTHKYDLVIDEGLWDSPCKGFPVYKLVNRSNGQVEGEGINLSSSIISLLGATQALEEAEQTFADQLKGPIGAGIH